MNINQNAEAVLNWERLPGRIVAEDAAVLLGFLDHDIPVLVQLNLLRPLGKPVKNDTRYFGSAQIQKKAQDERWLHQATAAMSRHWRIKNSRRAKNGSGSPPASGKSE